MIQQVGKYQLIRKLATGGMAEVFLAKAAGPMGFEKTLVLKRILPHLAEEPTFVQMFLSEAKLAARLTHPQIVQIFDFGEADGAYFLAMEYIDGPSLRTLVKRAVAHGPFLPPPVCARIIAQACEGLAFAHDFTDPETGETQGLIHRDISPDNILLSRQGAVKVVDFGIAKAAGQSPRTESGVIKGKIGYMPPEQLRARDLDRRVDVYALGVVLFELLTHRRPFESSSDVGLMQAILFEAPTPLADLRPDLPESLRGIIDRALAREREKRYPDCHAFQADLEDFILSAGKPVTTQQIAQLILPATPPSVESPVLALPLEKPSSTPAPPAKPVPALSPRKVDEPPTRSTQVTDVQPTQMEMLRAAPSQSHLKLGVGLGLLVVALLLMGGGLVLHRTAPDPQPVALHEPSVPHPIEVPPPLPAPPTPSVEPVPKADARRASVEPAPSSPEPSPVARDLPSEPARASPEESSAPAPAPTKPPSRKERPAHAGAAPKPKLVAAPTPVLNGTLEFRIRPFATIFINGKKVGDTPLDPLTLSAGKYQVRLHNEELGKDLQLEVEVRAGETSILKKSFYKD